MRLATHLLWCLGAVIVGASPARGDRLITFEFQGVISQNTHTQSDGTVIDQSYFAEIGDSYHGFVTYDATVPYVANTNTLQWTHHLIGEPNVFSATINGQTFAASTFDASDRIRFAPPAVDWWQSQFGSRESMGIVQATNLVLRDYDRQMVLDFDELEHGIPTTSLEDWEWGEFGFALAADFGNAVSGPLTRFEKVQVIPEPSSCVAFASLALTGIGIGWLRRRKK